MNIEKAKAFCRSLPGATEDVKWGADLVFSVGEKMFAVTADGIIPAPYLARAKWIKIDNVKAVSDAEAKELLKRSYELVFGKLTKKLQREIGGA